MLFRFFDDPYFRIKVHYRVNNKTLTYRTVVRKLWQGEKPSPEDFLEQLRNPLQLELSIKHLKHKRIQFAISQSEIVITHEVERTEMNASSMCEALGSDPDVLLQEIDAILDEVKKNSCYCGEIDPAMVLWAVLSVDCGAPRPAGSGYLLIWQALELAIGRHSSTSKSTSFAERRADKSGSPTSFGTFLRFPVGISGPHALSVTFDSTASTAALRSP